jgi:cyclohexadieny/prephenate dehydrogenase
MTTQTFETIAVIGLGLIGSSIIRGLRQHGIAKTLIAIDASQDVCDTVTRLNIADKATTSIADGVADADIVIVATPVGTFGAIAAQLGPALKSGAIVTDTGSVKVTAVDSMSPCLPADVFFVPAHPIAGTEHSGPEAGFAELFQNRWCILTPQPQTPSVAVDAVADMWEALGAKTQVMEPAHHDLVLAITSHLPHLIAYTIVGTATDLEEDLRSEVIKFSASGFRDFTRIAASDPTMWRDVFLHNREAVLEILQRFSEDLTELQKAIRKGDGEKLFETFTKTRAIRRQIIDAGQADYRSPAGVSVGTPDADASLAKAS